MQKGSAQLLLILVILLLLGSGVYLWQNSKKDKVSPASYNNYKNYINQKLGFEFQYSDKDITIKEDTEEEFNKRGNGDFRKNFKGYVGYEPGKFLGAVVVLDKDQKFDTNPLTIWVFNNPSNLSIDNWYKNYWYYPFVWGDFTYTGKFVLAPKQEATVAGQLGKSGVIDYQPGKPKFIYVSKDQKIYLFRIIGNASDQILATFKFLQ